MIANFAMTSNMENMKPLTAWEDHEHLEEIEEA